MEDEDDEFGELYVDVLQRISSSPITPQTLVSSSATRLPNLNPLANHEQSLHGPFNPADNVHQTLVYDLRNGLEGHIHSENNVTHINWNNKDCFVQEQVDGEQEQEMESNGLDKKSIEVLKNSNGWSITEPLVEVEGDGVAEYLEFDVELELKEQEVESRSLNFQQWDAELDVIRVLKNGDKGSLAETAANMETDVCIGDLNLDSKIPRYLNGKCINSFLEKRENAVDMRALDLESDRGTGTDYDKDSESEDSLKIILNDDDSLVPVRVNENGLGIDENIKAGEYLIIVAGNDLGDQGVEEKVLGEDLAEMGDRETMETVHGLRGCGELGNAVGAGIGYQDHCSRAAFKNVKSVALATPGRAPIGPGGDSCQIHPTINYVRPLAAAISGGAPIGPGDVPGSPLVNIDPVAGYGRVDRRPSGIKSAMAVLKLPSHMTVFDIDLDNFGEKPWRHPGIDLSDFFNFGLDEEKWTEYRKQMEQLCFEHSKQSKIFIYGSAQSEQIYDPYPPPELATTTGIRDLLPENLSGKTDVRKSELLHKGLGAANELSPTPIGSAIPVEVGVGERLPSVDSKRPRLRNSDAIIEIVLLDSVDEKDIDGEDFKEDIAQMDTKHCSFLHHNCKMQSSTIRKNIYGDRVRPFPLDGSYQYWPGFELSAGIFGTCHEESHKRIVQKTKSNDMVLHFPSRKKLESHSWSDCDRNPGPRHGRTAGTSTDLCKCLDNLHTRRRKDEEHESGEKANKEEFLHCYRTRKDSSRKKRERDDCLDERKDKRRLRCGPDYHHSDEHREESWHQKGRNDRPRLKQTPENNLSKRVREVRRTGSYQSSCSDCSANRFDSEMNIAEHKKIRMKSNGFKRVHKNILSPGKRKKYDHGSYSNEKVSMEGSNEQASEKSLKTVPTDSCDSGELKSSSSAAFTKKCHHGQQIPKDCHSSRKQREDASSSNSQRHSKRGRSKLERWTSNDEDSVDSLDSQTCVDEERVAGDLNIKIGEDAEKLKKQNKMLKFPMPNVKDLRGNRTMESESTAMIQNETAADSEIKHERPARKRKWVGS